YYHSWFVVSLSGEWHIVTAGHIFTETEEKLATGRVKIVSQTLSDRYGLGATHEHAYGFEFLSMRKVLMNEGGLDFAFIPVSPLYKSLMEKNGIVPFTEEDWWVPAGAEILQYRVIGFPDHLM